MDRMAYAMAKLVIAFRKLRIGYPNRKRADFLPHPEINAVPQFLLEFVSWGAQHADPELLLDAIAETVDGISKATVAVWIDIDVPPRLLDFLAPPSATEIQQRAEGSSMVSISAWPGLFQNLLTYHHPHHHAATYTFW